MADPSSPTGVERSCRVVVTDEQTDVTVDVDRWAQLASAVLRTEDRFGELTLTFVDAEEISSLNAEYMGVDGPTDVLSFPLDADEPEVVAGPVLLGDVVICPSVALEAAATHAGNVEDELALLTVHGVLHVLGHDHAEADEREVMQTRERELLAAHHWHGPVPTGFRQEHAEA